MKYTSHVVLREYSYRNISNHSASCYPLQSSPMLMRYGIETLRYFITIPLAGLEPATYRVETDCSKSI